MEGDLKYVFYPRSIAIVGASSNPQSEGGHIFLRPLLKFRYKGEIYPINLRETETLGRKAYSNVRDVPGPIDYVISTVAAQATPQLMRDCVAKGVKVVHFFTAGFSETGDEEGIRLEKEVVNIARQGGVRVIGPNCMGLHFPEMAITFEPEIHREPGRVSLFCQSGGNARELINMGIARGIHLSKAISYGNAADLNETDFLEFFAQDAGTEIIAAYIEGVKQGERFAQALRDVTKTKPVIVLKGGQSEAGKRAVASHTGALSGDKEVWGALCRQNNVIQVSNLEEMADVILAFSHLKPPRGRKVGIVGIGGGASVQAADDCENAGLFVPAFPPEIRQKLSEFTPGAGTSLRNPVDSSPTVVWEPTLFSKSINIVADYEGVDMLLVVLCTLFIAMFGDASTLRNQIKATIEAKEKTNKPLALVLRTANRIEGEEMAVEVQQECTKAGIPVYPNVASAARAISRFIYYYENEGKG